MAKRKGPFEPCIAGGGLPRERATSFNIPCLQNMGTNTGGWTKPDDFD